jgi:predicted permease
MSSSNASNHRASLALIAAVCGVVAVPIAILLSRQTGKIHLLDAVWSIPVAMGLSLAALLFVRGARGRIRRTLERAGGGGRIRLTRWLAIAGICIALAASIAVGFYELLVRLEH